MREIPSDRAFEIVARDLPVTGGEHGCDLAIKTRIGAALRRLYKPATEAPLEAAGDLLVQVDQAVSPDSLK